MELYKCQFCGCTTDIEETEGEINHWADCPKLQEQQNDDD